MSGLKEERIIQKNYLPSLILSALGIFVIGIAVSAIFLYLDIYKPLDTHYGAILSIISEIKDTLIMRTLKISGIFSFLVLIGLLVLVIFYTHRIAGPLQRIKVSAKAISEGRLGTKIKFRRKDVIHPFAECMNEMTDTYRERVKTLTSEIRELKHTVTELKAKTESGKDTETELKKVLDKENQIERLLNNINV